MADKVMKKSSELDALVPEQWSASFYPTLLAGLVFADSVDQSYSGDIQQLGDIVNISEIPAFSEGEELAEDAKADADSVTVLTQQLTINKQVVKDFIITSVAMRQSIDASDKLRELALYAVMQKMQSLIIADTVPSASAPDHQIPYDSGTTLALADILEAKELLDDANVPDDGQRTMILGSEQANDLYNITGFTSRDFIPAGSPLTSGGFATPILGFKFKMTTAAGDVARFFHPSYLTLAVQEQPAVEVFNLGADGVRARRVNMTVLFGEKQLGNTRVVEIG